MKFLSSGHAKAFGQPQSSNGTGNGAADRATWLSNGSRYVGYRENFPRLRRARAPTYLAWVWVGAKSPAPLGTLLHKKRINFNVCEVHSDSIEVHILSPRAF